jgi:hypothetical protein
MRLSILIPSIPSRFDMALALYSHLLAICEEKEIEILMLTDNKKRTIGEKREALKNISKGKYFMFVDDDDSLYSVEEIYEATEKDVDVITFQSRCRNNSGSTFIVTMNLGNPVEHNNDGQGNYIDLKRPPFPCCAWNQSFKRVTFPSKNYSEDAEWSDLACQIATSEHHIPKVIHGYNYDPKVSEAT